MGAPYQPDPDRSPRQAVIFVGVAAAVLNVVLFLLLERNNLSQWAWAPLLAIPALWGVGTVWMHRSTKASGRPTPEDSPVMGVAMIAILTSTLVTCGMAGSVIEQVKQSSENSRNGGELFRITIAFLSCCAWPAGIVCGLYLLVTGFRWVQRESTEETPIDDRD